MSLVRADARLVPLRDESVDLVVTSPPYFGLRSYTDDGEHYEGQIGDEPSPTEFLEALWTVTEELVRVLRPGGSIFVNLGDKMAGTNGTSGAVTAYNESTRGARQTYRGSWDGIRRKSLVGIPWRYAIGAVDRLGLILRAEIIWDKPNGLPESATDRVRRSHETWFHLVKSERYFSAVDEIREPHAEQSLARARRPRLTTYRGSDGISKPHELDPSSSCHVLGRLPGSVWRIATDPLRIPPELELEDHFAAFPAEWPRRLILGWSPAGYCRRCSEPRRPVLEAADELRGSSSRPEAEGRLRGARTDEARHAGRMGDRDVRIVGYECQCPEPDAPVRPAVVLDPFSGTGTTVAVARALGRFGIGLDLSNDYLELARWRVNDPKLRAKVLGLDAPKRELAGQGSLFEELS